MIARRAYLKRSAPPRRRLKPRRGPLRSIGYRRYLRTEGICAVPGCDPNESLWNAIIDPCHTAPTNGMSSKGPDSSCGPLCRSHHRLFDAGREAFEAEHGINMQAIAAEWFAKYQAEMGVAA